MTLDRALACLGSASQASERKGLAPIGISAAKACGVAVRDIDARVRRETESDLDAAATLQRPGLF